MADFDPIDNEQKYHIFTPYLILDEVLPLVAVQGAHHSLPDHRHGLVLAQPVLLDSLLEVNLDLLDRLLVVDAVLECSRHLLLGPDALHSRKMGNDLLLVGGDEDVLDVLRGPLVGREELVQIGIHSGLLQEAEHDGGALFSLDGTEYLQHEVESHPLLDLVLVDDHLEGVGGNHPGAQPEGRHLSQALAIFLRKNN